MVNQDRSDNQDPLDHLVLWVVKVNRDQVDRLDLLDNRVLKDQ
jgi:hypothetical protein